MPETDEQLRMRVFLQEYREKQMVEAVAAWAGVDLLAFRRCTLSWLGELQAALKIINDYPSWLTIDDGNVHALLKEKIRYGTEVSCAGIRIFTFKKHVEEELGPDTLAKIIDYNRVHAFADECVEEVYSLRLTRKSAERNGFTDTSERLLKIERELQQISQQFRKLTKYQERAIKNGIRGSSE